MSAVFLRILLRWLSALYMENEKRVNFRPNGTKYR
jgi:hypothetical protein